MKLDLKLFAQQAGLVNRVTGAALLNIKGHKNRLSISGEDKGRSMTAFMPMDGANGFAFAIERAVLDKTVKGRAQLDMSVDGPTLKLTTGKAFSAELQTQAYTDPPTLDKTGELDIDTDQQAILDAALPYVHLVASYEATSVMFFADFNSKQTRIGTMDAIHFAYYQTRGTDRTLELAFPLNTFQVITDTTKGADYKLAVTASAICAWNKDFELVLPFVQQEATNHLDDMSGMVAQLKKANAIIDVKALTRAVDSASATCESGDSIELDFQAKGIQISSRSSVGSVTERVKAEVRKSVKASIKPNQLLDMLMSVRTEEAEIGVHEGKYLYIRTVDDDAEICYGCLMTQAESEEDEE